MSGAWKYWSVCIAAILVIMMTGVPVMAAGTAKMAVPGIANSKCFGGSDNDRPYSFQQTLDGGLIIIGGTSSDDYDVTESYGSSDVWVVKLNSDLFIDWQKCYGGTSLDRGSSICQTTDGGYIFSAFTWSDDNEIHGYIGGGDIWVVKLNATGGIIWDRCLGGFGTDDAPSIQQTTDGGYIIAGTTSSGNSGNVSGSLGGGSDIWVVKLTSEGMIQWQKCLGGSNAEIGSSIRQTNDGGFILVGDTWSNDGFVSGNHDATGSTFDIWVAKLSEDGLPQWQMCLGGSDDDRSSSISLTSEGGYILVGYTESNEGDVSGLKGLQDTWVVKLDDMGTIEWQRCLGGSNNDLGYSIDPTSDGGYILGGHTGSDDGYVSGIHGGGDAWVVKLNAMGWPMWQRSLGGDNTEHGALYSTIQQAPDGGFFLVADTSSTNGDVIGHKPGASNADFWVVKLYGPPIVNGIAPSRVTAGMNPTIIITGENLVQGFVPATVKLIKPGTPDITLPVNQFSLTGTYLQCQPATDTFVTPGNYTLRVMTNDSQYVNVPDAFTVTCGQAPKVTSMTPTSGLQGSFIPGAVIKGSGFWTAGGVTAYLNRTGQTNVPVRITGASTTQLTAEFLIPAGAATGKWNLVVKNPDGQYAMKKDAFTVTLRTFKPPRVSSVTPKTVTAGSTVFINGISGSFFNASAKVAMTGPRGVSIPVSNVTVLSDTKITCDANLTSIAKGYATVIVTNPDGKKSTRARAFSIR